MPEPANNPDRPPTKWLLALWLLAGAVMLADLHDYPVRRTQEARVLETARVMIHSTTWRGWIIPMLDDQVRLRKPPLAYWTTALAYKIGGVSEAVGRVPSAIEGWLVLALTFMIGRHLFTWRAGFLAAASLLGSYAFVDFFRMAETDAPAALGVTLSVFAFLKADKAVEKTKQIVWYHVAAGGIALALMAKGGPALYPAIFVIAWSAFDRRWDRLLKILTSGALLTFLILGFTWFVAAFALDASNFQQFWYEIRNNLEGGGHRSNFLVYVPWVLIQTAPWTVMLGVALVWGIAGWRDTNIRTTLIWALAVLVPLCITGNKQPHYLLPAIPALMVLIGAILEDKQRAVTIAKWVTAYGLAIAAIGWLVLCATGWHGLPRIGALLVGAALLANGVGLRFLTHGRSVTAWAALAIASAIVWLGTFSIFVPSMQPDDPRTVANQLRHDFGNGRFTFLDEKSLPLKFYLADQLIDSTSPADVVLLSYSGDEGNSATVPPPPFVERARFKINKKPLIVYMREKM
jgi:4-amino-4-deoxy-L-arabinose transferase-like glycosyltransferase